MPKASLDTIFTSHKKKFLIRLNNKLKLKHDPFIGHIPFRQLIFFLSSERRSIPKLCYFVIMLSLCHFLRSALAPHEYDIAGITGDHLHSINMLCFFVWLLLLFSGFAAGFSHDICNQVTVIALHVILNMWSCNTKLCSPACLPGDDDAQWRRGIRRTSQRQ